MSHQRCPSGDDVLLRLRDDPLRVIPQVFVVHRTGCVKVHHADHFGKDELKTFRLK